METVQIQFTDTEEANNDTEIKEEPSWSEDENLFNDDFEVDEDPFDTKLQVPIKEESEGLPTVKRLKSVSKMCGVKVNSKLLPVKGYYFMWNAGTAPIVPFMSIYARQLGFSSVTVGIIYTILPFSGMLAKPLMGAIADKYRCQKLIFIIGQLIAAVAFLCIILLPKVPTTSTVNLACNGSEMVTCSNQTCALERLKDEDTNRLMHCQLDCPNYSGMTAKIPMNLTKQEEGCIYFQVERISGPNGSAVKPSCSGTFMECTVKCDSYTVNEVMIQVTEEQNTVHLHQFWLLLVVYLVAWIGQAITVSVGDAICFQILGPKPHRYGYQRMYGAMGWGIFSIISGFLVDAFSEGKTEKNYMPVFLIGVGLLLVCAVISYRIQYTQQIMSPSILRDIGRLIADLRIFIFMLWCISMGLITALMWNFLFWLLEDLAANQGCGMMAQIKTIEGLVMGIQCLGGELPFFFLSSWILQKVGHVHVMSLVLFVAGCRMLFYSILTNPWWCLPVEFLNGPTFGLFYAAMASYASIVAPPGTETTTQGLVGAVFEGIGVSLGSFLGGLFFQKYGGSMTFRINGIFALVACALHVAAQWILKRREAKDTDSIEKN